MSDRHTTPRLSIKVPDPSGHAERWRAEAASRGMSLAEFVQALLDAEICLPIADEVEVRELLPPLQHLEIDR